MVDGRAKAKIFICYNQRVRVVTSDICFGKITTKFPIGAIILEISYTKKHKITAACFLDGLTTMVGFVAEDYPAPLSAGITNLQQPQAPGL